MNRIAVFFFLFMGAAPSAWAINYLQLQGSHSAKFETVEGVQSGETSGGGKRDFFFSLGASYARNPLKAKDTSTGQFEPIVKSLYALQMGLSYFHRSWLMLGVRSHFVEFSDNNDQKRRGFSDPEIQLKIRLLNRSRLRLAAIPFMSVGLRQGKYMVSNLNYAPSMNGAEISPISDLGNAYGLKASLEWAVSEVQFAANLGYRNSPRAVESDTMGTEQLDYRRTLLAAAGAYIPLSQKLGMHAEFSRLWQADRLANARSLNELYTGLRVALGYKASLAAGIGVGNILSADMNKDYRFAIGLKLNDDLL